MKKEKTLQRFSFSYPEELQKQLEKKAKKQRRTLPALIKIILDDYLKKQKEV